MYVENNLSGLGAQKVKKKKKKKKGGFFKKVGRKLKKVAKVAVPAAAIWYGGPAALSLMKKTAGKVSGAFSSGASPEYAGQIAMDTIAPEARAMGMPPDQVQAMINSAYQQGAQQVQLPAGSRQTFDAENAAENPGGLPSWVLPVAIGAGVLFIASKS